MELKESKAVLKVDIKKQLDKAVDAKIDTISNRVVVNNGKKDDTFLITDSYDYYGKFKARKVELTVEDTSKQPLFRIIVDDNSYLSLINALILYCDSNKEKLEKI